MLPPRSTVSVVTETINSGAIASLVAPLGKSFYLLAVTTDTPARVRLYNTQAALDEDLGRPATVAASVQSGLIFEGITTNAAPTINLSPTTFGASMEEPINGNISLAITNNSNSPAAITATFTIIAGER